MSTENSISSNDQGLFAIGQHYHLISSTKYDPALYSHKPVANDSEARYLESCADVAKSDVANTLELLGCLTSNYPSDMGNEDVLLRQVGCTMRLLGEALHLATHAGDLASEAIRYHRLASQAATD